jgi:hypothetical protein
VLLSNYSFDADLWTPRNQKHFTLYTQKSIFWVRPRFLFHSLSKNYMFHSHMIFQHLLLFVFILPFCLFYVTFLFYSVFLIPYFTLVLFPSFSLPFCHMFFHSKALIPIYVQPTPPRLYRHIKHSICGGGWEDSAKLIFCILKYLFYMRNLTQLNSR